MTREALRLQVTTRTAASPRRAWLPSRTLDQAVRQLGPMPAGTRTSLAKNGRGLVYETPRGQARIMAADARGRNGGGYMRAQLAQPGTGKLSPALAADGKQPRVGHLKGKEAKAAAETLTHHDARSARAAQGAWDAVRGGGSAPATAGAGTRSGAAALVNNPAVRSIGRVAGRAAGPAAVLVGALDIGSSYRREGRVGRGTERAIGRTGGAFAGAAAGAAIGSMILPVGGTVVGAVVGGLVGSGVGGRVANSAADGARALGRGSSRAARAVAGALAGPATLLRNPFG